MEIPTPYILPTIDFVGGESQTIVFDLYMEDGRPYEDVSECTIIFSVAHFLDRQYGSPVIRLDNSGDQVKIYGGPQGKINRVKIFLKPGDTSRLSGKYIYQVMIVGGNDKTEIPGQGIILVTKNLNFGGTT